MTDSIFLNLADIAFGDRCLTDLSFFLKIALCPDLSDANDPFA
jgi:hypothetical protein